MGFPVYTSADKLPKEWDEKASSYFQARKFLAYADVYNPCNQRYYVLEDDSGFKAGACVYSLKIDLFTYSGLRSPLKMSIIGVPASVSCSGLVGSPEHRKALMEHIFGVESGIVLALNIPPADPFSLGICMPTLPGLELSNRFNSWDDYLFTMRSPYRRRILRFQTSFSQVKSTSGPCSEFTDKHYDLYLQVWNRSKTRLEKLSQAFLTNLPGEFTLVSYWHNGSIVAWHITMNGIHELVFFFGGTNYELNRELRSYYNNLAEIIKEGIEKGFHKIELGQTSEIAKMRLGAEVIPLNMIAYHRNPLARAAIRFGRIMLAYHRHIPAANVFKK